MTEKEKALQGLEFMRGGLELRMERDRAELLCYEYNMASPADSEKKQEILRQLIPGIKEGCYIKSPFICEYGTYISMGKNLFVNYNCKLIDGGQITFGDDVMIGPDCTFVTALHPTDPQRRKAGFMTYKPISVGSNVWFGTGVTVCPGVTIGDNCTIGAGSVVVRDIPAGSVAVGNPCRVIRNLD